MHRLGAHGGRQHAPLILGLRHIGRRTADDRRTVLLARVRLSVLAGRQRFRQSLNQRLDLGTGPGVFGFQIGCVEVDMRNHLDFVLEMIEGQQRIDKLPHSFGDGIGARLGHRQPGGLGPRPRLRRRRAGIDERALRKVLARDRWRGRAVHFLCRVVFGAHGTRRCRRRGGVALPPALCSKRVI